MICSAVSAGSYTRPESSSTTHHQPPPIISPAPPADEGPGLPAPQPPGLGWRRGSRHPSHRPHPLPGGGQAARAGGCRAVPRLGGPLLPPPGTHPLPPPPPSVCPPPAGGGAGPGRPPPAPAAAAGPPPLSPRRPPPQAALERGSRSRPARARSPCCQRSGGAVPSRGSLPPPRPRSVRVSSPRGGN